MNETIQNVPVKTLVSLCLVLRLNEDEAVDYLARCESCLLYTSDAADD